jgi:hypothetical protein
LTTFRVGLYRHTQRDGAGRGAFGGRVDIMEQDALRLELARAIASRKVPDDAIAAVAGRLTATNLQPRRIDICALGICIDYITDERELSDLLPGLFRLEAVRIRGIEIFPWGIPFPDLFRVRVEQEFDETAPYAPALGH